VIRTTPSRHHDRVRVSGDERGIVLPAAIVILFVVGTLLVSMMTLAMSDTRRAGRSMTRTELRAAAESELSRAFSLAISQPEIFDGDDGDVELRLEDREMDGNWWFIDYSGYISACPSVTDVCVRTAFARRLLEGNAELDLDGRTNEVLVEVEASARCDSQEENAGRVIAREGCMTVRYQQRLRRRQFFDYVQFTDTESLDPERYPDTPGNVVGSRTWAREHCGVDPSGHTRRASDYSVNGVTVGARNDECEVVAYQGSRPDLIAGPIHTNDVSAFVCVPADDPTSRVDFVGRLTTTGDNPVQSSARPGFDSGCLETSVVDDLAAFVDATGRGEYAQVTPLELPTSSDLGVLRDIAERDSAVANSGAVVLNGSQVTASGYSGSLPDGGVLFIDGDAHITQTAPSRGRLTIVATGAITVETNLFVGGLESNWNAQDPMDMSEDAGGNLLGLIAVGDLVIACEATPTTAPTDPSPCADRTLHAVLMSLNGSILTDGWTTQPPGEPNFGRVDPNADAPTLRIFGSLISRYRGVFGSYNPLNVTTADVTPGALVQGFRKEFVYDPRLRTSQPPYLLQPVRAAWERLDLIEVPPSGPGLF